MAPASLNLHFMGVHHNIIPSLLSSLSYPHDRILSPSTCKYTSPIKMMTKVAISPNQLDQSYWVLMEADIKAHLKQSIPKHPPLSVTQPIDYLIFASSPRSLAPALCIAACELIGGQRNQAIAAASALHLMHTALHTHEQLLLLKPKSKSKHHNHSLKPSIKLLSGDAILPLGLEILARSDEPITTTINDYSKRIQRVIIEITRAVGSQGILEGQYLESKCSDEWNDNDAEWMARVCKKKFGGFYACGAACGAILGEGSEEEIEKLRKYGFYVGMMHGMLLFGRDSNEHDDDDDEKKKRLIEEVVEGYKILALKELEGFKDKHYLETILEQHA